MIMSGYLVFYFIKLKLTRVYLKRSYAAAPIIFILRKILGASVVPMSSRKQRNQIFIIIYYNVLSSVSCNLLQKIPHQM